jgi:methionyl-tRNA formyltransferase
MGTPAFAVPSLRALAERHLVVLAVTRPDRPAGRGGAPRPSEVKQAALELGIDLLQPDTLRGETSRTIAAATPDVICVAAFGMLLPPEVLAIPPLGCINVHASLLPRHRGAAPIERAILLGDDITGVSIMRMEKGLDTGPYALQREVPVGDMHAEALTAALSEIGAQALLDALEAIQDGTVVWTHQDEARVTYAAKITKDDVALRPEIGTAEALRRIRASSRHAPARACIGDREITVVDARPAPSSVGPGDLCVVDGTPALGTADGALVLERVRPAGRGDMTGSEWARGARLDAGVCWRCAR